MRKNRIALGFCLLVIIPLWTVGCSVTRATATVDPTADLAGIKTIYVKKLAADERGIDLLIANKLESMGYRVNTGIEPSDDADVLVTYADKWMWDLTMYMIELTVTLRDPKTDFPLASGNSYRTSLARKSPEEMVDEVIDNIFKKGAGNE
jgi:hypothetical protein